MSRTVWTYPGHMFVDDQKMIEWCAGQGINATDVRAEGFHITQEADGSYLAHGIEYDRAEDGSRSIDPATQGYYGRERTWPVSGIPEGVSR